MTAFSLEKVNFIVETVVTSEQNLIF